MAAPSQDCSDLELARRCAEGDEDAWERFVREYRPVLYRAADSLDPSGGARDLADSLYADLYGMAQADGTRRSLFRYFHGRSSLGTWLRAVLAQRYIDRVRAARRFTTLPEDDDREALDAGRAGTAEAPAPDLDRPRYLLLVRNALRRAIAKLDPRDRLRIGCYYAQELTLKQTGRALGEHEATASRQLARTRRWLRAEVERALEADGLTARQIAECLEAAAEDPQQLDLDGLLRKESVPNRSVG